MSGVVRLEFDCDAQGCVVSTAPCRSLALSVRALDRLGALVTVCNDVVLYKRRSVARDRAKVFTIRVSHERFAHAPTCMYFDKGLVVYASRPIKLNVALDAMPGPGPVEFAFKRSMT